ncbi:MAG: hypothetical protein J5793_02770 [Clostridia bacterium]|nr:hypothetical protein [Clostridia bacterium]
MTDKEIIITGTDVFPNGTARPSSLQRYMQQAAREDCDSVGCTYGFMRSINMVFVVTKLGMRMFRPLKAGERLTLRTYNNSVSGITFDREYEFIDGNGIEAAHCSSLWVIVRYDTRALVRPRDLPFELERAGREHYGIELPRSVSAEGAVKKESRVVRLSDLDENDHLNNCVYPDIALDCCGFFDGKSEYISATDIIFRHEARKDDVLSLSAKREGDKAFAFAFNENSDKPCFEAEFGFTPLP